MHTNFVLIYLWICLCTFVSLIVYVLDILERTQSHLSFHNPHLTDGPCTSSLPAESTPLLFTCILLYLSSFKPFTCSYAWLFIFIIDQNRSMPYDRQGVQSMCNHEFLQRIFEILASSAIAFFCNFDFFHNFPFSTNQSFRKILSAGRDVNFVWPLLWSLIWKRT